MLLAKHLSIPLCVNHMYQLLETTMEHLMATNSQKSEWGVVGFLPSSLTPFIHILNNYSLQGTRDTQNK